MPSASRSSIKAGRAFVEIDGDDRKLIAALGRSEKRLRSFGRMVTRIGAVGLAAAAAFAPLGIAAVRAAANAEESLSRFAQVFGSETDAAASFAEDLAKRVGRSSLEIKDGLATFQSFFIGLGYNGTQARQLAQQMSALAIDFASFNNITDDEALGRFISALSGSSEVLDRFGVNTKQAALEQELLRMGINKAWSEVTEQEKSIARLNIIMRTMTSQGSVGDAERTAGSFTNQMKRLGAAVRDTSVAVGDALVPHLRPVVTFLAQALTIVRELVKQNPVLVAGLFGVALVIGLISAALLAVGISASIASLAVGALAGILGVVLSPIGAAIAIALVLTAVFVGFGIAILKYTRMGQAALAFLGAGFMMLKALVMPALNAIKAALASGNIEAAADVLWAGIKLIWELGKNKIISITIDMGIAIVRELKKALDSAQQLFFAAATGLANTWLKLVDQITGTKIASTVGAMFKAALSIITFQASEEMNKIENALKGVDTVQQAISDERIRKAREELERAIEAANQAADTGPTPTSSSVTPPSLTGSALGRVSSLGGFVALGGRAFSSENAAERTARATEDIKETTKRIQRELEQNQGAVFA